MLYTEMLLLTRSLSHGIPENCTFRGYQNSSTHLPRSFRMRFSTHQDMGSAEGQPKLSPEQVLNIVVTGGSTGIGRSIVETFAAAGHRVLFTYLHSFPDAEELEAKWKRVQKTRLDQGNVKSVTEFARVVSEWCANNGGVDVLVNNAALGSATVTQYVNRLDNMAELLPANPRREIPDEKPTQKPRQQSVVDMMNRAAEDAALMHVNALGPLWVTEALMDSIRLAARNTTRRGRSTVIFIGSVGGGSSAIFPEYCPADLMSKAAMTYLSKHLAARYVRDSIDVMCVSPGATETEMFRKSTLSKIEDIEGFIDAMPKRSLIQPNEIASTVFWLSTQNAARLFHGAVLDASMGLAVRPGLQTESSR